MSVNCITEVTCNMQIEKGCVVLGFFYCYECELHHSYSEMILRHTATLQRKHKNVLTFKTYTHRQTDIHTHARAHTHTHTHTHRGHSHIHTCGQVYKHTHTHTHTHAHT